MAEFIHMGGYGVFVWPSYLLSALVLAVLLVLSLNFRKTNEAELGQLKDEKESLK